MPQHQTKIFIVKKNGVFINGHRYISPDLASLIGEEVAVETPLPLVPQGRISASVNGCRVSLICPKAHEHTELRNSAQRDLRMLLNNGRALRNQTLSRISNQER